MGESKATRRIRLIMTKLQMEGKLDPPTRAQKRLEDRKRCRGCRRFQGFSGFNADGYCPDCAPPHQSHDPIGPAPSTDECCVGSLSRLPDGVVSCPDCPLDLRPEVR